MKNHLAAATQIAYKASPWVGAASMLIIGIVDLKNSKQS